MLIERRRLPNPLAMMEDAWTHQQMRGWERNNHRSGRPDNRLRRIRD
jgi:hypothetical protein